MVLWRALTPGAFALALEALAARSHRGAVLQGNSDRPAATPLRVIPKGITADKPRRAEGHSRAADDR